MRTARVSAYFSTRPPSPAGLRTGHYTRRGRPIAWSTKRMGHRWKNPAQASLDGAPFRIKVNAVVWATRVGHPHKCYSRLLSLSEHLKYNAAMTDPAPLAGTPVQRGAIQIAVFVQGQLGGRVRSIWFAQKTIDESERPLIALAIWRLHPKDGAVGRKPTLGCAVDVAASRVVCLVIEPVQYCLLPRARFRRRGRKSKYRSLSDPIKIPISMKGHARWRIRAVRTALEAVKYALLPGAALFGRWREAKDRPTSSSFEAAIA